MSRTYPRREFLKLCAGGALAVSMLGGCGRLQNDFELIIVGAQVYDGLGNPPQDIDLGIRHGRIAALGDLRDRSADRKLDAAGLAAAPGFIDFHSHSDDELLLGGDARSKIRQGVTTEILGQDGDRMAPLTDEMLADFRERLEARYGVTPEWRDFRGYYRQLASGGMICNALSMVGQGTLREYVVGMEDRPATADEIRRMQTLAEEAFRQGAFGISSGLEYTPGSFAGADEIIALCRSMAGRGVYATHMRNEDDTVLEALEEALRIASEAGVAAHISHLKASGQRNWGKLDAILARMDAAREAGLPVTCDRYPYIAYNTGLSSLFPLWSREGGREAFVERLRDPALQDTLRAAVQGKITKIGGWQQVMVSSLPRNPQRSRYEGETLAALSAGGDDPYELLVSLVTAENGGGDMVGFAMSEENTARLLAYPQCMIASDASALATEGALRRGNPHPRSFGSFPRVLGKYVRDEGLIPLVEAIRKMTSLPAGVLGLSDRGRIAVNAAVDLMLFDPATVKDNATWSAPHHYPDGIPYVLVNGKVVIDREEFSGALPGRVLRQG